MNPTIRQSRLERERRLDPSRFSREYEAEFVDDLAALLPSAWVDDAIVPRRYALPPIDGCACVAAVDLAGGGQDKSTISIVHAEGCGSEVRIIQDLGEGLRRPGQRGRPRGDGSRDGGDRASLRRTGPRCRRQVRGRLDAPTLRGRGNCLRGCSEDGV